MMSERETKKERPPRLGGDGGRSQNRKGGMTATAHDRGTDRAGQGNTLAMERARDVIRDNPQAWRFIEAWCMAEVRNKRRFSMRCAIEQARKKDWSNKAGEPFRLNNNLSPAFARILVEGHPEARPFVEMRRAECDGL